MNSIFILHATNERHDPETWHMIFMFKGKRAFTINSENGNGFSECILDI
jgi:hypothetical protein